MSGRKADLAEDLAESRTDLAEDRTLMANERTYAGWMRTGMAAVGIGLGFNALFSKMEPVWAPKAIATAFLIIGIFVFAAAERRASAIISRLETHRVKTVNTTNLRILTIMSIGATIALVAAMWLLRIAE